MDKLLAMFLPLLALQLSPILIPMIAWTLRTAKDRIVAFRTGS